MFGVEDIPGRVRVGEPAGLYLHGQRYPDLTRRNFFLEGIPGTTLLTHLYGPGQDVGRGWSSQVILSGPSMVTFTQPLHVCAMAVTTMVRVSFRTAGAV